MTIAGYAHEKGCGSILLLNKWDMVEKDRAVARNYMADLREASKFMSYAPAMTISALTGQKVKKIFPAVREIYSQYNMRIGTGQFNRILEDAVRANEPSLVRGRRIKFYYGTQVSTGPPTFVCFVNYSEDVHFSYIRYIINQVRAATGLDKTPIRLFLRQRTGSLDNFKFGDKHPKKKKRAHKR
jgi:GTP-binding protein